jgi:hypothetical protein
MTFLSGTYIPHGRRSGFVLEARHGSTEDTALHQRAQAPVEAAIRSYLGAAVDDATVRNATSIVMRGLTPLTLQQIAAGGMSGTDIIQTLIPRTTPGNVLPPFNWSSITPAQIELLRAAGLLRGDYDYRRALALAMRGGGSSGSREYNAVLGGDLNTITRHNYAGSPYDLAGVHFATFDYLRGQGFNHQHIMNAAHDAEALGFRGNHAAIHDHAIIDRHSIDARGMNAALLDYQRRTREDAELRALLEQRRQATTQAEQDRLDALIQARRLQHERGSGLYDRLHNPEENQSARGAGGRRKDAIDRQREELLLNPRLTEEERVVLRTRVGETEFVTADATAIDQARQGRSQAELNADFLATAGVTPTSIASTRVPGGSPGPGPAVVVRTDTATPDQTLHPRPTVLADAPSTGPRQGIG